MALFKNWLVLLTFPRLAWRKPQYVVQTYIAPSKVYFEGDFLFFFFEDLFIDILNYSNYNQITYVRTSNSINFNNNNNQVFAEILINHWFLFNSGQNDMLRQWTKWQYYFASKAKKKLKLVKGHWLLGFTPNRQKIIAKTG